MFNFDKYAHGQIWQKIFYLAIIFLVAVVFLKLIDRLYKRLEKKRATDKSLNTMRILMEKIFKAVVVFVASILALDTLGVNTRSILATAGIGTLIIGLGAQSLVEDFINGFFILTENQYQVGEYIHVGSLEGVVEDVGLRMTKIRSYSGEVQFIPNGMMNGVVNTSRTPMRAMPTVHLPYEADLEKAMKVINDTLPALNARLKDLLKEPIVLLGVTACNPKTMELSLRTFTVPEEQWLVEREILKDILLALKKAGIPLPKQEDYDAALSS